MEALTGRRCPLPTRHFRPEHQTERAHLRSVALQVELAFFLELSYAIRTVLKVIVLTTSPAGLKSHLDERPAVHVPCRRILACQTCEFIQATARVAINEKENFLHDISSSLL